jgi:hypothetical protein
MRFTNDPIKIKNKRTAKGGRNPHFVTAQNELRFRLKLLEDFAGMYKPWTKEEIQTHYTDEVVTKLLADGRRNLGTRGAL